MAICQYCHQTVSSQAAVCPNCGQPLGARPGGLRTAQPTGYPKSHTAALLLCFFFGALGLHRFYLGKWVSGLLMLFTLGGLGIWLTIDMLVLVFGNMSDSYGRPCVDKSILLSIIILIIMLASLLAAVALVVLPFVMMSL